MSNTRRYVLTLQGWLFVVAIALLVLAAISIIFGISASLPLLSALRIVFGTVYLLFLPGFVLSYVFFPQTARKPIDFLERFALSFALSIAVVPLAVFYLSLIGVRISALSTFFVVLGIVGVSFGVMCFRSRR